MDSDLVLGLQTLGVAAAAWLFYWSIWTGRLRWLNDNYFGPFAVTLLPALAASWTLFALAAMLGQFWLVLVAGGVGAAGLVLYLVTMLGEPDWVYPPWFHEERDAGAVDTRGRGTELTRAVARRPTPPSGLGAVRFERGAVLLTDEATRPAAVAVRHGRVGRLFVCEQGLAFAQADSETILRGEAEPVALAWYQVSSAEVARGRRGPAAWLAALRADPRGQTSLVVRAGSETVRLQVRGADEVVAEIDAARRRAGWSADLDR